MNYSTAKIQELYEKMSTKDLEEHKTKPDNKIDIQREMTWQGIASLSVACLDKLSLRSREDQKSRRNINVERNDYGTKKSEIRKETPK